MLGGRVETISVIIAKSMLFLQRIYSMYNSIVHFTLLQYWVYRSKVQYLSWSLFTLRSQNALHKVNLKWAKYILPRSQLWLRSHGLPIELQIKMLGQRETVFIIIAKSMLFLQRLYEYVQVYIVHLYSIEYIVLRYSTWVWRFWPSGTKMHYTI